MKTATLRIIPPHHYSGRVYGCFCPECDRLTITERAYCHHYVAKHAGPVTPATASGETKLPTVSDKSLVTQTDCNRDTT